MHNVIVTDAFLTNCYVLCPLPTNCLVFSSHWRWQVLPWYNLWCLVWIHPFLPYMTAVGSWAVLFVFVFGTGFTKGVVGNILLILLHLFGVCWISWWCLMTVPRCPVPPFSSIRNFGPIVWTQLHIPRVSTKPTRA